MSKYLSSLLGSQNIKSILGTSVSGIKKISGIDILHLPLGTILMYHGSGINAPTTKSTEISVSNSDSFDMKGWYVCNNKDTTDYALGFTTNLVDKFVRMEMEAGNTGGNNDAPYIIHSHTLNTGGGHTHSGGIESVRHRHDYCNWWGQGTAGIPAGSVFAFYNKRTTSENDHTHTANSDGAHSDHGMSYSGSSSITDKNIPYSRSLIFIERLRIDDYQLPLGTVFMYHGTAISDIEGKGSDLSSELGMPGWYVCNGVKAGTVDMIDNFVRSRQSVATGTSEGSNNVTLRYHNHTENACSTHQHISNEVTHTHGFPGYINYALYYLGYGGSLTWAIIAGNLSYSTSTNTSYNGDHTHSISNNAQHYHSITTVGDNNGVGYNMPSYKTLIFIQKVEAS